MRGENLEHPIFILEEKNKFLINQLSTFIHSKYPDTKNYILKQIEQISFAIEILKQKI